MPGGNNASELYSFHVYGLMCGCSYAHAFNYNNFPVANLPIHTLLKSPWHAPPLWQIRSEEEGIVEQDRKLWIGYLNLLTVI